MSECLTRRLGADGVMIGRPWLYGLACGGEEGVTNILEIIRKELDITMGFCGHTDIMNVKRDVLLSSEEVSSDGFDKTLIIRAELCSEAGGLVIV
eukprot:768802-Hanusia_phi.AAC.4